MKDKDFKRIDMIKAQQPPKKSCYVRVVKNSYWLIDKDGHGLIYKKHSLQCNTLSGIGKGLILSKNHPAVEEKFFETIFIEAD